MTTPTLMHLLAFFFFFITVDVYEGKHGKNEHNAKLRTTTLILLKFPVGLFVFFFFQTSLALLYIVQDQA